MTQPSEHDPPPRYAGKRAWELGHVELIAGSTWLKTPGEPLAEDGAIEWWEEYRDSVYYQVLDMEHRRQLHDEFMAMLDAQAR